MNGQHPLSQPSPNDGVIETPVDSSERDHRKKRRNRMTQSCISCHNSKRKCDRKRPWCQRCVQLGLTGLCVYEVDDLADRDDVNADENTLLKKRVADLESLVRQMKGKPQPRCVGSSPREGNDLQDASHSRAGKRRAPTPDLEFYPAAKSARLTPYSVKTERPTDESLLARHHHRFTESPPMSYAGYSPVGESDQPSSSSQHINYQTPTTYVPPSTSTPPYSLQIPSSFSTLSGGLGEQPVLQLQTIPTNSFTESSASSPHCSCRNIPTINNTYHSLSNHLQSALFNLGQYAPHSRDPQCILYKKIDELNKLIHGRDESGRHSWSFDSLSSAGTYTESDNMTPISSSSTTSYIQTPLDNRSPGTGATVSPRRDWPYPPATGGIYQTYPPEIHDRYLDYGNKGAIS